MQISNSKASSFSLQDRIELFPNTYRVGAVQASQFWRLFIVPMLIGIIVLYQFFQWRQSQLLLGVVILLMAIVNVYFFFYRQFINTHKKYLLILEIGLYLFDHNGICLKADKEDIRTYQVENDGRIFQVLTIPAVSGERVLIGAKCKRTGSDLNLPCIQAYPDYWLVDDRQWTEIEQTIQTTIS